MYRFKLSFLIIPLLLLIGCDFPVEKDSKYYCLKLNLDCTNNVKHITFITSKGEFQLKLFADTNPITVANFISNIQNGIYKNKTFYSILNYQNNNLIQGGIDESHISKISTNDYLAPAKKHIPLEISFKNQIEPKYNEPIEDPIQINNLRYHFSESSIAMKKIKEMSSSTEFFFSLNKSPHLDGRYSLFGEVVKGIEILRNLERGDKIIDVKFEN